jgi:hypothetical protein
MNNEGCARRYQFVTFQVLAAVDIGGVTACTFSGRRPVGGPAWNADRQAGIGQSGRLGYMRYHLVVTAVPGALIGRGLHRDEIKLRAGAA